MTIDARAAFTGIEAAKARVDSNYIRPCDVWAKIEVAKLDQNRKKRVFFALEMTVIHRLPTDDGNHRIGESVTHLVMQDSEYFLSEIKSMFSSILGVSPEEIDADDCAAACSPDNPLAGTVVHVQATNIETRQGNDFTKVSYKREVPMAEVVEALDEATLNRFFDPAFVSSKLGN